MATTSTDFNLTIEVGNQQKRVTIYAADLDKISTKGFKFSLPPDTSIEVGTLKDLIGWMNTKFKSLGVPNIPEQAETSWPKAIGDVFNGVLGVVVTVTKFSVEVFPEIDGHTPNPDFSIAVTGMIAEDKPKIDLGVFRIVGGGVGITRINNGAIEIGAGSAASGTGTGTRSGARSNTVAGAGNG